jgi:hypothetical protein
MRPFITSLVVLIAAVGCTEPITSTFDPDYSVRTLGQFERLDADSGDLAVWVGVESTLILDHEGTLVCEEAVDIEAWEIDDQDAELSLGVVRGEIRELIPDCSRVYNHQSSQVSGQRFLSFVERPSRYGEQFGTVYTSEDFEEWEPYASGMLEDGSLVYHHTRWIMADSVREPPARDPLDGIRDPAEAKN